jgi:hypothetical protein
VDEFIKSHGWLMLTVKCKELDLFARGHDLYVDRHLQTTTASSSNARRLPHALTVIELVANDLDMLF